MNDINWLDDENPYARLGDLEGAVDDRRLRLAGVEACRLHAPIVEDELCRAALELAERYADHPIDPAELDAMHRSFSAQSAWDAIISRAVLPWLKRHLEPSTLPNSMRALRRADGAGYSPFGLPSASFVQRTILDDVFGKLYRSTEFRSEWLTRTVTNLARAIYDDRSFEDLPILADALEDADCAWTDILDHLRGPGPHYRGCWALDHCLGLHELTEEQWLTSGDPLAMYLYVHPLLSERKIRLLACACCRRIWDLADDLSQNVLTAVELPMEGKSPVEEYLDLNSIHLVGGSGPGTFAFANLRHIDRVPVHATGNILRHTTAARSEEVFQATYRQYGRSGPETERATQEARQSERAAQAKLLRCIVGNPFHPVTVDASWQTPTVVALAQNIYDDHDFAQMPELADALAEVGCDDDIVLSHCRDQGPHARGCWVLDGLLDRG